MAMRKVAVLEITLLCLFCAVQSGWAEDPSPDGRHSGRAEFSPTAKGFTNSIGMEFIHIEPGSFIMGSPEEEQQPDEKQHEATLTKSFYMGRTEVTQAQWKEIMGTEPWKGVRGARIGDDCPAVGVTWLEARDYCRRLIARENGNIYRLPTEAEWEYACRAGTTTRFSHGHDEGWHDLHDYYGWFKIDRENLEAGYAYPVAQKKPNPWGLYDMHGNVWEWCHDWYAEYPDGEAVDYAGPETGEVRALRSGGCHGRGRFCRSANRIFSTPDERTPFFGFRVALTAAADRHRATTVGFDGESIAVDYGAFLSKHDVVYLSPPENGWEFLPVGNGDLAAPVWTPTPGTVEFNLNKSDTWENDQLRACGKLTLHLGADLMSGENFRGRLDLHKATGSLEGRNEAGSAQVTSFVDANANVLVIRHSGETRKPADRRIELTLWRTEGVEIGAEDGEIWLRQTFPDRRYALAGRVVGAEATTESRPDSRSAAITLASSEKADFTVLLAAATSTDPGTDPLEEVRRLLDETEARTLEQTTEAHEAWWRDFWQESFVSISDDYLENLYYTTIYNLACTSRGEFPVKFNGGLWLWQEDARGWEGHYWHLNTEETYWPLYAANHLDLLKPYYKMYWDMLPVTKEMAAKYHGVQQGAWYGETLDRWGYPDHIPPKDMGYMLSPGVQMGYYFYWYYLYTGDEEFLRTRAYPILKECIDFYLGYMKKDEAGIYYIYPSAADETPREPPFFKNPVVDVSNVRVGCQILLEASRILGVDQDRHEEWQEVITHLPPYPTRVVNGKTLFAQGIRNHVGVKTKTKVLPELANVFPAGDIGMEDEGTRPFQIAVNTVQELIPHMGWGGMEMGVFAARVGLKKEAWGLLQHQATFQIFPQGFFHYFEDAHRAYDWGKRTGGIIPYLEPAGIFGMIVNESLLQSHDRKIRVFPALPDDQSGAFRLRAVGSFMVSSEIEKGEVKYIAIESLVGGPCTVVNPWIETVIVEEMTKEDRRVILESREEELSFDTARDALYVVRAANAPLSDYAVIRFGGERNTRPKRGYGLMIGKE